MATTVPIISERMLIRSHFCLPVASAKPAPRMGLIRGDSSMAPITTAGEDWSIPRMAMPADIITIKI